MVPVVELLYFIAHTPSCLICDRKKKSLLLYVNFCQLSNKLVFILHGPSSLSHACVTPIISVSYIGTLKENTVLLKGSMGCAGCLTDITNHNM